MSKPKNIISPACFIILTLLFSLAAPAALETIIPRSSLAYPQDQWLSKNLNQGEAIIRYLFHSGWAIRTQNHFLIFDYTLPLPPPNVRSVESEFISPGEISGQNVTVFISHSHSDHYNPIIQKWREFIPGIRYVWGWPDGGIDVDIRFGSERETINLGGLEILNVHHEFDNIPESAFLVKVDGLTLFFAGDHCHSKGLENPVYKSNLEYLAKKAPGLDLFFTPTFGGEMSAIQILNPRVVFPMHDGGREGQYKKFTSRVAQSGLNVQVGAAARSGDVFFYFEGRLVSAGDK